MKNNETPTRELESPRTEIGEGLHVEDIGNAYIVIEKIRDDMWALFDGEPDTDAPATLLEKHQRPFERKFY